MCHHLLLDDDDGLTLSKSMAVSLSVTKTSEFYRYRRKIGTLTNFRQYPQEKCVAKPVDKTF
jgi:hypothetical protein